jgi:hypothetical protein
VQTFSIWEILGLFYSAGWRANSEQITHLHKRILPSSRRRHPPLPIGVLSCSAYSNWRTLPQRLFQLAYSPAALIPIGVLSRSAYSNWRTLLQRLIQLAYSPAALLPIGVLSLQLTPPSLLPPAAGPPCSPLGRGSGECETVRGRGVERSGVEG